MTADVGLLAGEQLDLRLLAPSVAAWIAALLALGWSPGAGLIAAVGLTVVALLTGLGLRRAWALTAAAAALCAAGSCAAVAWRLAAIERGPLPALAHARAKVTLELVVGADPRLLAVVSSRGGSRSIVIFPAKAVSVTPGGGETTRVRSPVFVLATGRGWLDLQPSQHVLATGRLETPKPGEFETATFAANGPPESVGAPSPMQRAAGVVRAGLRAATAPLPPGPGGLLPGLVDGDVSRLPPDVAADFKTTGLTHLVAVSGANVAILLGVVLMAARWAGLRSRGQALAGALAIIGFVVVARPQPSVLRAAAMGLVVIVALATGRRRRALPALCAAVLLLVYVDPTLARSVGFALSVLATGALLVLAPPLRERFAQRMPRWLAEALAVPTAATLVCSPLIASFAGQVSLAAVPANLLAEPAVAPATILGVVTACVAPWWTAGARWIAEVAALPCAWLVWVARTFARLPAAAVSWPTGVAGALELALVFLAFVVGLRLLAWARRQGGS